MDKFLTVNEIFFSIQGESYLSGLPCVFVRLTGCHQRCVYCDTEYAFFEGQKITLAAIQDAVQKFPCQNLLITGGEPLLQSNTPVLVRRFLDSGYRVAVETGGARPVEVLPRDVIKIMDLKTPGSGESHRNRYENLKHLDQKDEIKFVVTGPDDMDWSLNLAREHDLTSRCHVSLSPVSLDLLPEMAEKILAAGIPVRLQHQLHKLVWPQKERGF